MTKADGQGEETLSALWAKSRLVYDAARSDDDEGSLEQALALETAVLRGPIGSSDDLLAKLRAIQLSFYDGPRTDEAEIEALAQACEWLSQRSARRSAAPGLRVVRSKG